MPLFFRPAAFFAAALSLAGCSTASRPVDPGQAARQKCMHLITASGIDTAEGFARLGASQKTQALQVQDLQSRKRGLRCALTAYWASESLDPGDPELHLNLGELYQALGDDKTAAEQYREALRLDPKHQEARQRLARIAAEATGQPSQQP